MTSSPYTSALRGSALVRHGSIDAAAALPRQMSRAEWAAWMRRTSPEHGAYRSAAAEAADRARLSAIQADYEAGRRHDGPRDLIDRDGWLEGWQ
jgi:hypothetical protein